MTQFKPNELFTIYAYKITYTDLSTKLNNAKRPSTQRLGKNVLIEQHSGGLKTPKSVSEYTMKRSGS